MVALQDENRELMLSMYIDGELDAEEKRGVEEKVQSDPAWREEYENLLASEERISKVVENNWHDSDLTDQIMERVRKMPRPSTATALAAERNAAESRRTEHERERDSGRQTRVRWMGWVAAAAAIVLFGVSVNFLLSSPELPSKPEPITLAEFDSGTARVVKGPKADQEASDAPIPLLEGATLSATAQPALVRWKDGTRIWLRREARLKGLTDRGVELLKGTALVDVARATTSFRIGLPDGSTAEAIGTRFEVELAEDGAHVRVVEGIVRRLADGGRQIEASGGQRITPDYALQELDPRSVSAEWTDAGLDLGDAAIPDTAAWPQLGGAPNHSGLTPYKGPMGQPVARAFHPFPTPGGPATQYSAAILGAGECLFVLRPTPDKSTRLFTLDLRSESPQWETCGDALSGIAHNPPAITPTGLVVYGTSNRKVRAWNPEARKVAWTREFAHSVWAVSTAYDGMILCSTFSRLVALDETGKELWSYKGLSDIQAPAAVTASGDIVVISATGKGRILDRKGKELKRIAWPGQVGVRFPPVVQEGGSIWLTSSAGALQRVNPQQPGTGSVLITGDGVNALPLGMGLYAKANTLHLPDGTRKRLHIDGPVVALARDGAKTVFAAIRNIVYRVADPLAKPNTSPQFQPVKRGQVVPGGIAVLPGKLVVTTTDGVQVFE